MLVLDTRPTETTQKKTNHFHPPILFFFSLSSTDAIARLALAGSLLAAIDQPSQVKRKPASRREPQSRRVAPEVQITRAIVLRATRSVHELIARRQAIQRILRV